MQRRARNGHQAAQLVKLARFTLNQLYGSSERLWDVGDFWQEATFVQGKRLIGTYGSNLVVLFFESIYSPSDQRSGLCHTVSIHMRESRVG